MHQIWTQSALLLVSEVQSCAVHVGCLITLVGFAQLFMMVVMVEMRVSGLNDVTGWFNCQDNSNKKMEVFGRSITCHYVCLWTNRQTYSFYPGSLSRTRNICAGASGRNDHWRKLGQGLSAAHESKTFAQKTKGRPNCNSFVNIGITFSIADIITRLFRLPWLSLLCIITLAVTVIFTVSCSRPEVTVWPDLKIQSVSVSCPLWLPTPSLFFVATATIGTTFTGVITSLCLLPSNYRHRFQRDFPRYYRFPGGNSLQLLL